MRLRPFVATLICLGVLFCAALPAEAQQAGKVTKHFGSTFIVAAPRSGVKAAETPITTDGTAFHWNDTLKTGDSSRLRAQLTDGSILSLGQKAQLKVLQHDARSQQSSFELLEGKVRADVVHLSQPNSNFDIRTNTAVCGVLGTDEVVDADSPTATVVISISGVVTVRSSDPNVVGSVQLSPGQTTTVRPGQAPTGATTVTFGQLQNAVNGTTGTSNPDPVVLPPGTVPEGGTVTLDGRSSTGGLGSITAYQWSITNPQGQQVYTSTQPVLSVATTGWNPGIYNGSLTVTNSNNNTSSVTFQITVVAPLVPIPQASATITALAAAYQGLQVRNFMNLFDPTQYTGYAALEQGVTQSFKNIQSITVNILTATVTTQGNTAIAQVTFQTKFTPSNTALPSNPTPTSFSPNPPQRAQSTRGAGVSGQGSISGSAGAVATFVLLSGTTTANVPVSTATESGTNSLNYSFTNLADGNYTVTPVRNGFTFSPASLQVTITNGSASTVNFTAQPQTITINEAATLRMTFENNNQWMITDIQGALGSAGLVGIPGTNAPANLLNPTSAVGGQAGLSTSGNTSTTPGFTVASANVAQAFTGGTTAPQTLTVTPQNGFTGPVSIAFTPTTGVTPSGPSSITVGSGAATGNYTFAVGPTAGTGLVAVPYTASSTFNGQAIAQSGFFTLNVSQLTFAVTGAGQSSGLPLTIFAGGSTATSQVTVGSLPAGFTGPATLAASGNGVTGTFGTLNNGVASLTLTTTTAQPGPVSVTLTATPTAGGPTATTTLFVNVMAPFGTLTPSVPSLTLQPSAQGGIGISVPFTNEFTGSVVVTPPALSGVSFSPSSVTLTASGTANFTATAGASPVTASNITFTAKAGTFTGTAQLSLGVTNPFNFSLAPGSLTIVQGGSGSVSIAVTQTAGVAVSVTVSAGTIPSGSGLTVTGGGSVNGSGSVSFQVSAALSATVTTVTIPITASGGGVTQSSSIKVVITSVGGFNLSVNPSSLSVFDGQATGSVTLSVAAIAPFSGAVAIQTSGTGATASGSASINAGSSATYNVSLAGSTGSVTFTGTNTSIGQTQTATATLTLVPGFTLTVAPVTTFSGASAPVNVTVNCLTGFTGRVNIAPGSAPSGVSLSPSSQSVSCGASGAFTATLTANAQSGNVSFSGIAQGGSLSVAGSGPLALNAPFAVSNATASGFNGFTTPVAIPVSMAAGFPGNVVVTPAGGTSTATVSPSSVTLQAGQTSANFVLTFSEHAVGGTILFNVTSPGTSYTQGSTVTVTVAAPFTLGPGANFPVAFPGGSATVPVQVTLAPGFTGSVALSAASNNTLVNAQVASSVSSSGPVTLTAISQPTISPSTVVVALTASAGGYSVQSNFPLNVALPFTAQLASNPNISIFRGFSGTVTASVTANPAFAGGIVGTLSGLPAGVNVVAGNGATSFRRPEDSARTGASPSSSQASLNGSGTMTFQLFAQQSVGAGPFSVTLTITGGGITNTFTVTVSFSDPYSVNFVTVPSSLPNNSPGTYVVQVVPNSGFTGSVSVTPTVSPAGSAVFSPAGPVTVSANSQATFTVTVNGGVTGSVTLGVNTSATGGSFVLNRSANSSTGVTVPFSITVQPQTINIYDSLTSSATVTVNFAAGYAGTVTVAVGNSLGRIQPDSTGNRRVASFTPGNGISQISVSGGNPVTSTGGQVTFNILGSGSGTGSLTFTATDANNNSAAANASYSASLPFTVSTPVAGGTIRAFDTGNTSISVQVTPLNNFAGTVVVSGPGAGGAAGSLPAGLTFDASTAGQQSLNFNGSTSGTPVTVNFQYDASANAAAAATTGAFTFVTGNYSTSVSQSLSVAPPFTATQTVPSQAIDSVNVPYVVTVTPAAGFGGSIKITPAVTATPSASVTGSIGTPQTVSVSSQNDVAFTVSFTATPSAATTAMSLGSTVQWVGQSFNVPLASTALNVVAPFTIVSVTPNPLRVYTNLTTQTTVTVRFAAGYQGTVTVGCSVGGGPSNSPARRAPAARRGAAVSGCSGGGISSVAVNSGSNGGSNSITSDGTGSSVSLIFDVIGSGAGGSSLNFTATDTAANSASNGTTFTAGVPFTISTPPLAVTGYDGFTVSSQITVTANNFFTGSVMISAPGSGSTAGSLPTGLTFDASSQSTKSGSLSSGPLSMTVVYDANATAVAATSSGTQFVVSTVGAGGTYSATAPESLSISPPFSISAPASGGTIRVFDSSSTSVSVQVTPLSGFAGTVMVSGPGAGSTAGSLPTGLTFDASTAGTQSLTFNGTTSGTPVTVNFQYDAGPSAAAGTSSGNFTFVSGNYSKSVPQTLSV